MGGVSYNRNWTLYKLQRGHIPWLTCPPRQLAPRYRFVGLPLSRMATSAGVLFIVGGGPRIGHSVAKRFLQQGYKVAVGRRNTQDTASSPELAGALPVSLDVTKPRSIEAAFDEVESKLGIPNVVVYNGRNLSRETRSEALRASRLGCSVTGLLTRMHTRMY